MKLYTYMEDNKMLFSRIVILKNTYFDFLRRSATEHPKENEKLIYLINCFDQIYVNFSKMPFTVDQKEF